MDGSKCLLYVCSVFMCFLIQFPAKCHQKLADDIELMVFTVATDENDGFRRFMKSAQKYDYNVRALGLGQTWQGGDVANGIGGGHKVNILREVLEPLKHRDNLLVLFVDSYDLVFAQPPSEVLRVFDKIGGRVLFSAEGFCWPDATLADQYPEVSANEKRYLNSGMFMGYAPDIYEIVSLAPIAHQDDDQYYYTQVFLDSELKERFQINLDTKGEVFQNLNGALDEVRVKYKSDTSYLYNFRTGMMPAVVHGNGPIKPKFNTLANYLNDRWTPTHGCQACNEDTISLEGLNEEDFPLVMIGIYVSHATPFLTEMLNNVASLEYPKQRISLYIHNTVDYHVRQFAEFLDAHAGEYKLVIQHGASMNEWQARNQAVEECISMACQYYFSLDGEVQIEHPQVLTKLIEANRTVIAPLMVRVGKMWSNFWGALAQDGYYKRSDDYVDILHYKQKGQWNVPHVSVVYLVQGHVLPLLRGGYINGDYDADMAFSIKVRSTTNFMYVDNQEYYGHLTMPDSMTTHHLHNDMYQIFDNKYDWEKKYLHPEFKDALSEDTEVDQPCTDVFWIPFASDTFCLHLIEEMENLGDWSGGKHEDERLAGGYENVPTVDIHTNQIEWEQQWLQILKDYVGPIAEKVFQGHHPQNHAIMNFVVRYKPTEQPFLRPHHDSSTFSVNIALNEKGVDYEGGGTRFGRYNCSVTAPRRGWMLMHPGRLTHIHEGLPTTSGTRYIMVSFVDP